MLVVIVIAALVVVGTAVALGLRARGSDRPTGATRSPGTTRPPAAPAAGPASVAPGPEVAPRPRPTDPPTSRRPDPPVAEEADEDDDEAVDPAARFNRPGQRATRPRPVAEPVRPAVPVRHLEPADPVGGTPPPTRPSVPPVSMPPPEPESVSPPEPVSEPEPVPESEPVSEPAARPAPVIEPAPAPEPVVGSEPAPDALLDQLAAGPPEPDRPVTSPAGPPTVDVRGEEPLIDLAPTDGVDHVLQALVDRVRITHQDVVEAATELVERANLDAEEAAEVLSDLIERAEDERLAVADGRDEELMFFSDEVPRRPGQLTHFADLEEREKRRVIIRVLCLLVAANVEERAAAERDAGPSVTAPERAGGEPPSAWPLARAVWPVPATEESEDPDLPARRSRSRLARARR